MRCTNPLLIINNAPSESLCPSVRPSTVHVWAAISFSSWSCPALLPVPRLYRSLERKLQRPLLAKSRTLPSIPQSPTVSRVHQSDLIGGSPLRRKTLPTTTSHLKACTLPPAGELPPKFSLYSLEVFFLFPLPFSSLCLAKVAGNTRTPSERFFAPSSETFFVEAQWNSHRN